MKNNLFKSLLLVLIATALPQIASAYDFMVDGLCYNYNDDGTSVTITYQRYPSGDYNGYVNLNGELIIPASVTYNDATYSVTGIGYLAFYQCSGLTSVTIPNSVTTIGELAFYGCSGLTSLSIGNSVTSIGDGAFEGCTSLTSVTIPNSVTSIGSYAFNGTAWYNNQPDGLVYIGNVAYKYKGTMPSGTSIALNSGCVSISPSAFSGCSGLTSVTIPNSVTQIGNHAFSNCTGLTSVTIPNSVTSIGRDAFYGTAWYNNQPDGLVYIGNVAYKYKGEMPNGTSIILKDGCTVIADGAFNGCTGLTSVTISNSVTTIGESAFSGCTGLTSVTIPNSVTTIGGAAFYECSGLTSLSIGNSVTSIGGGVFWGCTGLTSVTIPNSVTEIGEYTFLECTGLTSVTIGNSVTSIPYECFYNCSGLTSVTIGNSVTSIGESAFSWCDGLTSVTIPNSVTSIGNDAFYACYGLTSVSIGNSVTSIGNRAFAYCRLTSVTIPNSVTSIGNDAFSGCTGLTSATIGNSVATIGNSAFVGCTGLTSVTIGNSVTTIGNSAFQNCRSLTSITLPNSVTSIGNEAFEYCSCLTSLSIGNSVTTIGESAFSGCTGLTGELIFPNSVTSIGGSAFNGCNGLETIIWNAKNCNAHFEYTSQYSATSIFAYKIAGVALPNIKTFIFGKDVQKIPDGLCFHLNPDEIYVSRKGRPVAIPSEDVFFNVDLDSCTLYVPAESEQIYWASYGWCWFLNIVPWNPTPEIAGGDANEDGVVNIGDYVSTASYILERNPQPFNFEAADIDGNGTINVVDLVCVADLALNYLPSKNQAPATVMSDAVIGMDAEIKERNDNCYEVIINLSNDLNITAVQMDMTLPEGMTLIGASLSDRADASHQVEFEHLSNGDYRLLASSSANKAFSSNYGTLLTLTLAGMPSSNSVLRNIILASPENTGYELDDITLSFETSGVDEINSITKIYCDDENIIIDSPVCGLAQIVLPNGMSQTIKVQAGRNVYPAPVKGLVIVKMNDNAVKLFR